MSAKEIAAEAKALHKGIGARDRKNIADACKIGHLLEKAKAEFAARNAGKKRGDENWEGFKKWVESECEFCFMQARRYTRLAAWVDAGNKLSPDWSLCSAYRAAGILKDDKSEQTSAETPALKTGSGVSGSEGSVVQQSGKIISLIKKGKSSGGYICFLPKNADDWTAYIGELSADPKLAVAIEAGLVLRKGA